MAPIDREWEFLLVKVTFGTATAASTREIITSIIPEDDVTIGRELNQASVMSLPISVSAMPEYSRADFRSGEGLELVAKHRRLGVAFSGPVVGWSASGSDVTTLKAYSDLKYLEWIYPQVRLIDDLTATNHGVHTVLSQILFDAVNTANEGVSLVEVGANSGWDMSIYTNVHNIEGIDADQRAQTSVVNARGQYMGFGGAVSDRLEMFPGKTGSGEEPIDPRNENLLEMIQRYSDRSPEWRFDFTSQRDSETGPPRLIVGQWKTISDQTASVRIHPEIGLDRSGEVTISETDLVSAFSVTTSLEPPNYVTAVRAVGRGSGDTTVSQVQKPLKAGAATTTYTNDSRVLHDAYIGTGGTPDEAYYRRVGLRMDMVHAPDIDRGSPDGSEVATGWQISDVAKRRLGERSDPWIAPDSSLRVKMASEGSPGGFGFADFSPGDTISLDFDVAAVRRASTSRARVRRITYNIGQITTATLEFF